MTEPTTPPAEGTRWRGFTHRDLYLMLHDGPGAAASAEPSRRWAEIASTLTEIGQDLQKALDLTGSGWTGRAAGAAYSRLSTTVAWANATGTSAGAMRTAVEDQANHIAKARAEMPKPEDVPATQPDPTVAPALQVVGAQTDAEAAEAAASSAEERAVEVMTAYETSTSGTTGGLATFAKPDKLLPSTGLHQGDGSGFLGLGGATVASLAGGPRRDDDRQRDGRGGRGGPGGTYGASASEEFRPRSSGPVPGPGRMTGVSTDPYFAAGLGSGGRSQDTPRRGNVVGASPSGGSGGSGGLPGGPKTGLGGLPTPELQQAQQAAAAANQAAAQHASGAPIAPGAGGPVGAQEKMAMRRLGMDAIGSSQWFGDTEEPVPGQSPKRRFDLRQTEDANESASILDEENQLPPGVIGEGGR
jgi:hypothetical protein